MVLCSDKPIIREEYMGKYQASLSLLVRFQKPDRNTIKGNQNEQIKLKQIDDHKHPLPLRVPAANVNQGHAHIRPAISTRINVALLNR